MLASYWRNESYLLHHDMGHLHKMVLIFLVNLRCLLHTAIFLGLPTRCVWSHRFDHRQWKQMTMGVEVAGSQEHTNILAWVTCWHVSNSICYADALCRNQGKIRFWFWGWFWHSTNQNRLSKWCPKCIQNNMVFYSEGPYCHPCFPSHPSCIQIMLPL